MAKRQHSSTVNWFQVSPHFTLKEFECPCCQQVKLEPRIVELLEKLREIVGKPIIITSGYRCEVHNRRVGGEVGSYHLYGMAVDIAVTDYPIQKLIDGAIKVGFGGIGKYRGKNFIHVDIGPERMWER